MGELFWKSRDELTAIVRKQKAEIEQLKEANARLTAWNTELMERAHKAEGAMIRLLNISDYDEDDHVGQDS